MKDKNNITIRKTKKIILYFDEGKQKFILHSPYSFKDKARSIPTSRWNPETKTWIYLYRTEVYNKLLEYESELDIKLSAKRALERLRDVLEGRKRVTLIKDTKIKNLNNLPVKNIKPFNHQIKAFNIGMTLPQTALLMEQRTGKTLSAIAIAGQRFINKQIKRLLIIKPVSVAGVWEEQLCYANFPYILCDLTSKKNQHREKLLEELKGKDKLHIVLINFESTWRFFQQLIKWDPDMVIIDESQKIKNGRAKQSKTIHRIGDRVEYKLILTGTPITQGPLDVWSQYRFLNSDIFPKKFVVFRERYAVMGGYGGYEVIGHRNLEELAEKAHSIAYRVTKEEALDLPPIVDQIIKVNISNQAMIYYKQMEKNFLIEFNKAEKVTAPIVLTQLLRLQQITGGFLKIEKDNEDIYNPNILVQMFRLQKITGKSFMLEKDSKKIYKQVDSAKLKAIKELFEDLPMTRKIVVFARFIPEIYAIAEVAKKIGRRTLTFTGKTKDRDKVIKRFQTDKDITVFVLQIQTGGLGIDLSAANIAIFYSTNLSFGDYDQAKSRLQGPKQKVPITYIHLLADDTRDEDILNNLRSKKKIADLIVDIMKNIYRRYKSEGGVIEMSKSKKKKLKLKKMMKKEDFESNLEKLKDEVEGETTEDKKEDFFKAAEVEEAEGKKEKTSPKKKTDKTSVDTGIITVKMLAREFKINSHQLRKILRTNFERKDQSRWEWKEGDKELEKIRKLLSKD